MQKTILFCANTAWCIYQYRNGILTELISKGVKVVVVAPGDHGSEMLKAMGCEVIDLQMSPKGVNPGEDLLLLKRLYRIYKAVKPDFIFHFTIKPNIYGALAAKLAEVPSICMITGLGYTFIAETWVSKIANLLYKVAFRFPKEIWFLNRDDQAVFLQHRLIKESGARLLPGEGINTSYFSPIAPQREDHEFYFLMIGRLLWDKGVGEYVQAARTLRKRYPHVHFQLLGAAGVQNPSAVTPEQIETWNREGAVEYLGSAQDVRPYIARSDCVVLPSYREGLPRTLLEAAAMGRPLVATDVPGCREVTRDGINGYLCDAKSSASLEKALEKMVTLNAHEQKSMGEASRKLVMEQFEESIIIRRYLETLHEYGIVDLPSDYPVAAERGQFVARTVYN